METTPSGLLLSRDLMFTVKITSTAKELGRKVKAVGRVEQAEEFLAGNRPRAVFVDLTAGELASRESLTKLMALAPDVPFIAFGPHVEVEAFQAARDAGCREVMPRSKFTAQLPDLIRAHLGDEPTAG
ncbi:response regulator [Paludisphaera sp.]|uniref:response regulator n=1 Tax=Paludisphaera sp. TaxID=2017432 RepID=UPI00301BE209